MSLCANCRVSKIIPHQKNAKFLISVNPDTIQEEGKTETQQMFWLEVMRHGKKAKAFVFSYLSLYTFFF